MFKILLRWVVHLNRTLFTFPPSSVMILAPRKKCGHCKVTYTTCEFSVHPAHNYHKSFDIPEPWCAWFWPVMITSFNIIVSTLHDQFWQIGVRPHGWQIGFCHSLAIEQINLSSFKLFLSLSVVDLSCVLWNAILLQLFTVLCCQKVFLFLLKLDICACCALFVLMTVRRFLEQNKFLTLKMYCSLWGIFIGPS